MNISGGIQVPGRIQWDPNLDAAIFFKRAEQLFADYEIPEKFQAKVIDPFFECEGSCSFGQTLY